MKRFGRRLRKRRWTLLAITVLLALGAVLIVLRSGPDVRAGSVELDDGPVRATGRLRSYRITYRIEIRQGDGGTTSTDDIIVSRPFDSKLSSNLGTGLDVDVTVSSFGRYSVKDQVFAVQPGIPDPDRRLDAVLREAVREGFAGVRERREVLGRVCRVHRLGAGSDAVGLPPLRANARDHTDVCVDGSGLILEEVTFANDEVTRRRIATKVEESPTIDRDLFDLDAPSGDPKLVGSVKELEDDSRIPGDEFWELGRSPKGFKSMGRYAVVPPGQPGFTDPTAAGTILAFLSEVWSDGFDVVVIDQGAAQSSKPFEPDDDAVKVKGGELGQGELRYGLRESEVRFLTGASTFVRIRGSVAPSRLLAIARSLEAKPGGPLLVKD